MDWLRMRQLFIAITCLSLCQPVFAGNPQCAAMEASGPQWFSARLDGVQATYQGGNSQGAWQQLWAAMTDLPRRADVSLDARCVGTTGWRRMYQLRQAIAATLGKQAENIGKLAGREGALDWYVLGDNRDDARRIIKQLTPTARDTAYVINRLRSEVSMLDHAQQAGFELLTEEQSARAFWQTGLGGMNNYATKMGMKALALEEDILTRDATAKELALEDAQEGTQSMVAQFFSDQSLAGQNEAQREVNRAKVSLRVLGDAEDWLQAVSAEDVLPVRERALARGDALMAKAADPQLGLEARDSLYKAAGDYFEFADNSEGLQRVAQARAGLAPALEAEQARRKALIREKQAELQQSAREQQQALQKTDAEKARFQKEADALEDELGF